MQVENEIVEKPWIIKKKVVRNDKEEKSHEKKLSKQMN